MSLSLFLHAENELRAQRVHEALALFHEAERNECDPDVCSAGRWECYMRLGDFERAWRESDAIAQRGKPDPNRFWHGRPLCGARVLVRCLHGLGDTIQFVRYVPLLRQIARSVVIESQPTLKTLLAESGLADHVMTWTEPEPKWDQQVEIMELPRIFRTTLETIPRFVPYIHVADGIGKSLRASGSLRIGIAWQSSRFNPARSVPIEQFAKIFSVPGISFFGLQPGPEHEDLQPWAGRVSDMHQHLATIRETAQLISGLDLVITVDTMMAHLAGALAVPVWTLLPFECDWRWMLEREDSPWYPTMRLFRQPEPGDWNLVIERIRKELRAGVCASHKNGTTTTLLSDARLGPALQDT